MTEDSRMTGWGRPPLWLVIPMVLAVVALLTAWWFGGEPGFTA